MSPFEQLAGVFLQNANEFKLAAIAQNAKDVMLAKDEAFLEEISDGAVHLKEEIEILLALLKRCRVAPVTILRIQQFLASALESEPNTSLDAPTLDDYESYYEIPWTYARSLFKLIIRHQTKILAKRKAKEISEETAAEAIALLKAALPEQLPPGSIELED